MSNWLSNRVFTSYDDIVDHCCEAWNKLVDRPWIDHVHRHARLGPSVTIIGIWYKPAQPVMGRKKEEVCA